MLSYVETIEEVASWLGDMGLGNGADRFHSHLREIRKQEPLPEAVEQAAEMGFIHLEAVEFVDIWAAFRGAEDDKLIQRLKKALGGDSRLSKESSDRNVARNTMFELALAARLRRGGVAVEFGEPDLVVSFPEGQYVIECKRPFRDSSVRANIKDAAHQLRENLQPAQHGVIAVSLSRVINPGNALLGVEIANRDAVGAVYGDLLVDLNDRCWRLISELASTEFSPGIAALMFETVTPFITEKGEGISGGFHIYDINQPKLIAHKIRSYTLPTNPAYTYFKKAMGRVMNAGLAQESLTEIERSRQGNTRVLGMFTKEDPTNPIGLILPYTPKKPQG